MMNKIKVEEEREITLSSDEEKEIYLFTQEDCHKVFILNKNSHLTVYHYHIDHPVELEINLNGENAEVEYHFSMINYQNHQVNMKINHHDKKTVSHVFNHGVNIKNNQLSFQVTGKIEKNMSGCICNQENQIINLEDGKGVILPSLFIDHNDISSSHSAYIGKFKDEVLFYLMSRGLSIEIAQKLLIHALLINGGDELKEEVAKLQQEIENI